MLTQLRLSPSSVLQAGNVAACQNKSSIIAVPGFEPGLPDSESGVLTTTLYRSCQDGAPRVTIGLLRKFITYVGYLSFR